MTDWTSPPTRCRALVVLVILAAATASAAGQPAASVPVDSLARSFAEANGLPSLVVGVTVGGQRQVLGVGAIDSMGTAPDAHTLYEIGSVSKVLTSLALADAITTREVTLTTPVAVLLPDSLAMRTYGDWPIRLVDLATHTSGLPRLPTDLAMTPDFNIADPYALYTADRLLAYLETVELETAPGDTYSYSNLGAGLLGYALALHSGTTYAENVRTRVLAPLGIRETILTVPNSLAARFADAHGLTGDVVPHWTWTDATAGAGGWRSTAGDLLTFVEAALTSDGPLAEPMALALSPQKAASERVSIGLGWHLSPFGAHTLAWHNGMVGGAGAFIGAVPDLGVGVVVLTNRQAEVDGFAVDVLRRLVDEASH